MSYPYEKTYLEQIQEDKKEMSDIQTAYWVLKRKYAKKKGIDTIELSLKENFAILGEAFELASEIVGDIHDSYHFMWDIMDALFPEELAESNKIKETSTKKANNFFSKFVSRFKKKSGK